MEELILKLMCCSLWRSQYGGISMEESVLRLMSSSLWRS